MHIYTCWHDVFLAQAIRDYEALAPHQSACRLVVGAHDHWGTQRPAHLGLVLRFVMACLETHLPPRHPPPRRWFGLAPLSRARSRDGDDATPAPASLLRPRCPPLRGYHSAGGAARPAAECALPVQLCLLGTQRWVGYATWPPPVTRSTLYLTPTRQLASEPPPPPPAGAPPPRCAYTYTPSEPTPAAGGPSFNPLNSGAHNQRAIERRPDVLVFSTPPLPRGLRLVGRVVLRLRVAASARAVDLLGRLCLVTPLGSVNLCEGLASLIVIPGEAAIGAGGGRQVTLTLGPVAAEFEPGTRLRLHVSSAAHPRWARNLCGDPEVPWAQRKAGAASCRVHVWADGSSALVLPLEGQA